MKQQFVSLCMAVLVILFSFAVAPASAQAPVDPPRAPRPADDTRYSGPAQASLQGFEGLAPQWGEHWVDYPEAPFAFTRFDGDYSLQHNMVYFMGGRLPDGSNDGSVWSLSPGLVYSDMGVDLVTPVANYTMNLLEDANGAGFYIFCGQVGPGVVANAVQVYYPDSNTAVQLGAEDNYPGSGTCTAGLNAVYNNKVYVAGGYDYATPPYNWGETWVFDPLAPAGSRWTQIPSANLNHPRAYMMSAVVDDRIYAIGGSFYDPGATICGSVLCDETIVEVLDLSDPAPVWDDAAVVDLPEACSEGRAYGFDTSSQYADTDGTHLSGRIVTACGGWAAESERVYVLDTQRQYWSAFPPLNRPRRDQAGVFIPNAAFGIGLMFVWGGRSGFDANVLTIPERYLVKASGCPILLVDDDWDFDSSGENDGGRPYYQSALNYLGYPYSVWDTISMGTPEAADLAPYHTTVWFTGYDWHTPISTTEQTELIAYLEGGGNLVMSSQDQHYAYPGSTIMTDYFRVDSVTGDVTLRAVEGNAADPLFAGLGAYTLARPDDYAAYWPAGMYEGPYDDAVSAAPGASEPLIYSASGQASATRYDGGHFKTVYLGFPLEWVDTVQERAQILGAALRWMCPIMEPTYLPLVMRDPP